MEWFRSRTEARVIIEAWRNHYNNERPHSSLDYQTPNEFIEALPEGAQPSAVLWREMGRRNQAGQIVTRVPRVLSVSESRCEELGIEAGDDGQADNGT